MASPPGITLANLASSGSERLSSALKPGQTVRAVVAGQSGEQVQLRVAGQVIEARLSSLLTQTQAQTQAPGQAPSQAQNSPATGNLAGGSLVTGSVLRFSVETGTDGLLLRLLPPSGGTHATTATAKGSSGTHGTTGQAAPLPMGAQAAASGSGGASANGVSSGAATQGAATQGAATSGSSQPLPHTPGQAGGGQAGAGQPNAGSTSASRNSAGQSATGMQATAQTTAANSAAPRISGDAANTTQTQAIRDGVATSAPRQAGAGTLISRLDSVGAGRLVQMVGSLPASSGSGTGTGVGSSAGAPAGVGIPTSSSGSGLINASPSLGVTGGGSGASTGALAAGGTATSILGGGGSGAASTPAARLDVLANRVLDLQLSADPATGQISGAALKEAVQRNGPFMEAMLAAGRPEAAGTAKAQFGGLMALLGQILGGRTRSGSTLSGGGGLPGGSALPSGSPTQAPGQPGLPQSPQQPSPPQLPQSGAAPKPQPPVSPMVDLTGNPVDLLQTLARDAEGALHRARLLQLASLPDGDARAFGSEKQTEWQMDVPLRHGGGESTLGLTIQRDAPSKTDAEQDTAGWRVRFAVELEDAGSIHALIHYAGHKSDGTQAGRLQVGLWAENDLTAERLRRDVAALRDMLQSSEIEVEDIAVEHGTPPAMASPPAASGLLIDQTS
jgi:hypothetical protein